MQTQSTPYPIVYIIIFVTKKKLKNKHASRHWNKIEIQD